MKCKMGRNVCQWALQIIPILEQVFTGDSQEPGKLSSAFQPLHETARESNSEDGVEVFADDDLFHLALQSICLEEIMEPKPLHFLFVCLR